jgi:hypothetical protein
MSNHLKYQVEYSMVKDAHGVVSLLIGNTEMVRVGNDNPVNVVDGQIEALERCAELLENTAKEMRKESRILRGLMAEVDGPKDPNDWDKDSKALLDNTFGKRYGALAPKEGD